MARVEAPTVLYRITEKFPAYLRALPFRHSGPEKLLFALKHGGSALLAGDGSRWVVVGHS